MTEHDSILVTGATGFLGSVLVCKLLLRKDADVYCVVKTDPGGAGADRLRAAILSAADLVAVPRSDVLPRLDRLKAIAGDITKPNAGVSAEDVAALRRASVRTVWHSAAYLRFEEEYRSKVNEHNVQGTRNVFGLGQAIGVEEFNHISTAYVAGKRAGPIPEASCASSRAWESSNPYEESKRDAETWLEGACPKAGVYLRILRPSIIIGSTVTYASTSDFSFDGFIYGVDRFSDWVRSRLEGYFEHFPLALCADEGYGHNFIPVDVAAQEAIEIAEQRTGSPEYHHLTNPYPVGMDVLSDGIRRALPDVRYRVVHDRRQLETLDHVFAAKLFFYQPYFFASKQYERRKKLDPRYRKIEFTPEEISKYAAASLAASRRRLAATGGRVEPSLRDFERVLARRGASRSLARGEGDVVLLLCPPGVGVGVWEQVAPALAEHARVVVLDDPLYGREESGASDADVAGIADALAGSRPGSARVVAWDAALPRAVRIARSLPDAVGGIVAVNPFLPTVAKDAALRTDAERALEELIDESVALAVDRSRYHALVAGYICDNFVTRTIEADLPAFARWVRAIPRKHRSLFLAPFLNATTLESFGAWGRPLRQPTVADLTPPAQVPVTVVRSGADAAVSAQLLAAWARGCARWEERVVPSESHWLPLDAPDVVLRAILRTMPCGEERAS